MNKKLIKADHGFGTVGKVDAGYYSQGFFFSFFPHLKLISSKINK